MLAALGTALLIGTPTDVVPNPWFGREIGVRTLDVVVLVALGGVTGALLATYAVAGASGARAPRAGLGSGGRRLVRDRLSACPHRRRCRQACGLAAELLKASHHWAARSKVAYPLAGEDQVEARLPGDVQTLADSRFVKPSGKRARTELGLSPAPALRELERRTLQQDRALELRERPGQPGCARRACRRGPRRLRRR